MKLAFKKKIEIEIKILKKNTFELRVQLFK